MSNCMECYQQFSRRDAMLRHMRNKHGETSHTYPPPPPPPPQETTEAYPPPPPPPPQETIEAYPPPPPPPPPQETTEAYPPPPPPERGQEHQTMVFQHPFTMMVSGPTACGKTTFVKDLLRNHASRVQPRIQRIVWLYKRWQPLYTVIQRSISPRVEFHQGIPTTDLDDNDFFDPRINNLLILDDLFTEANKGPAITSLYTEGSHHRSLSVISINQNLFGTKDPTQRRNCHYLVLFNNPIDRQCVMTLARQMYPGHTDKFMSMFAKATKYPYGYLLVDLKPFTAEKDRLKYDIPWHRTSQHDTELTNQMREPQTEPIKEKGAPVINHSSTGVQTVHIGETLEQEERMAENANACGDCGLLFDTSHDVQRHVKSGWCPEICEPPAKKSRKEDSEMVDEDVEENEGFLHLWEVAQKSNKEKWNKFYDQYIEDGDNQEDACEKASERARPYQEKLFFEKYQCLLDMYWFPLMNNATHTSMVKQIDQLRRGGLSLPSAVKRVLKKNKKHFADLFEQEMSDSDSDSESEEDME